MAAGRVKSSAKTAEKKAIMLNDGSCVLLKLEYPNHVWSYDFVMDRTHDGRAVRMLAIIDEYTRECLEIDVSRKFTSMDVICRPFDLFIFRGCPQVHTVR